MGKVSGGDLSSVNLVDEARTAPGIKITSPRYGTTAFSHQIGVRIEARDTNVQWVLRYQRDTGMDSFNPESGTQIGTGGTVSLGTSVDATQFWSPPSPGNYVVILEATAHGDRKYYDIISLSR
jgi:hypothetical protein